ncbi:hypothetical protein H6P81_002889 [Aristolochia fimbriata]|uniref:NADH-ubiquinone oxidoreductase 21kDa subunit N-terminal domain-containing protein n=1 Tax=Aristolochia fimbriata TaxID=158543 RepID=A0AAV7FE75_ARIFI|nr:hypothetical protein H6P81_002889 [Aristolochia fimbriata]
MNTDITASVKPEYPVIDRNPPFTNTVANFSTLDYCRFLTITGISITVGYLSGIKPNIRGPSMVTGGLIGVMGGFMYAYQNSAGRLMGFFPNEEEVKRGMKGMTNMVLECAGHMSYRIEPLRGKRASTTRLGRDLHLGNCVSGSLKG